jgi:hypothetical protein
MVRLSVLSRIFHGPHSFTCEAHTFANMNQMCDPAKRGHSGAQLYFCTKPLTDSAKYI